MAQSSTPDKADDVAAAVEVEPGATCLDRERVIAHVRMWLAHARIGKRLRIRVTGDPHDRYRVAYEIIEGEEIGRREFNPAPKSCDDLHAILGLTIALALDSEHMQRTWLQMNPPARLRRLGALQLTASSGVLPDFALGLQMGIDVALTTALNIRAEAFTQFAWNNAIAGSRGYFDVLLAAGSFGMCAGGRPHPRLRLALCTGIAAGVVAAWGHGYASNTGDAGPWVAWRSGVRFDALLGLRWLLDLDVISRIYSPAFEAGARAGDVRREPSMAGLALSLGPYLDF